MTPEQEAERLVELFSKKLWDTGSYAGKLEKQAKACAIICVDEIISSPFIDFTSLDFYKKVKEILKHGRK